MAKLLIGKMNPKKFLIATGILFIIVALLGAIGIIGPTSDKSIFSSLWYFDVKQNIVYAFLGSTCLVFSYFLSTPTQRALVVAIGILAFVVSIVGFFITKHPSPNFFGANLENPLDNIFNLVVGIWALLSLGRREEHKPNLIRSASHS